MAKIQIIYDEESKHGADVAMQKKWDDFIVELLTKNPPLEEVLKSDLIVNQSH